MNGKYITEKHLGSGTSGSVYLCKKINSETDVAVKSISSSRQKKSLIEREVRIQNSLQQYENFPKIIECFEESKNIYIVQEYCEGGSLADYIKTTPNIPYLQKQQWIYELLIGIQILHENGIIHRDIKTENLLVKDKKVKIGDFGLAKKLNNGVLTTCGTPFYMAPEEFSSSRYNFMVDIWSAGVVAYEILKGKRPFMAENLQELIRVLRKEPDYEGFTENEKEFIKKMLKYNPRERAGIEELLECKFFKEIPKNPVEKTVEEIVEYANTLNSFQNSHARLFQIAVYNFAAKNYSSIFNKKAENEFRNRVQKLIEEESKLTSEESIEKDSMQALKKESLYLENVWPYYSALILSVYQQCNE